MKKKALIFILIVIFIVIMGFINYEKHYQDANHGLNGECCECKNCPTCDSCCACKDKNIFIRPIKGIIYFFKS